MNNKVFGNAFFSIVDKVLVLFFNTIISIMIARYLGAADYGRYTYFVVIYLFATNISSFGLERIVTKEFATNGNQQKAIFYAALVLSFFASFFTELGVIVFKIITGSLTWLEVAAIGAICIFNINLVFKYYLTAVYQLKNAVKFKNFTIILMVIINIILIIRKASVEYFILTFALRECCIRGVNFWGFICSKKKEEFQKISLPPRSVWPIIKKFVYLCSPLLFGELSATINLRIDQLMIRSMLGEEQLGIYSGGIKLVEVFFNIPIALTIGVLPYFAEKYMREPELFWKRFEQLANGLNTCAYFFVIMIVVLGKWLINFLYGEEYLEAAVVLAIYVWAVIPVCMRGIRGLYLTVMEYSRLSFLFSILASVTNIILNLFLIPSLGIIGASVASVITYLLEGIVFSFFSTRLRKVTRIQLRSMYGFIYTVKDLVRFIQEGKTRR